MKSPGCFYHCPNIPRPHKIGSEFSWLPMLNPSAHAGSAAPDPWPDITTCCARIPWTLIEVPLTTYRYIFPPSAWCSKNGICTICVIRHNPRMLCDTDALTPSTSGAVQPTAAQLKRAGCMLPSWRLPRDPHTPRPQPERQGTCIWSSLKWSTSAPVTVEISIEQLKAKTKHHCFEKWSAQGCLFRQVTPGSKVASTNTLELWAVPVKRLYNQPIWRRNNVYIYISWYMYIYIMYVPWWLLSQRVQHPLGSPNEAPQAGSTWWSYCLRAINWKSLKSSFQLA